MGFLWMAGAPAFSVKGVRGILFSARFQWGVVGFLALFCGVSLYRFFVYDVNPLLLEIQRLEDAAVGGGLRSFLWREEWPRLRNAHPFGHQNYTSGFLLLVTPWLWFGWIQERSLLLKWLTALTACMCVVVMVSLQSRNTVLGLVLGTAAVVWTFRGARLSRGKLVCLVLIVVPGMVLLSPRLHTRMFDFESARMGMWRAAWVTGLDFFPFGSGEGLTSEMLNRIAPSMEAGWGSSLQFHQTWLHGWAAGGVAALLGLALFSVAFWFPVLGSRERLKANPDVAAPSVFALAAYSVVMLADYQLNILPVALALTAHFLFFMSLAPAWKVRRPIIGKVVTAVPFLVWMSGMVFLGVSYRARVEVDAAGEAFEHGDYAKAVRHFDQAGELFPETYTQNMAAYTLARNGDPAGEAIERFEHSLEVWEPQPLVHDMLMALYFQRYREAPSGSEAERAALTKVVFHALRLTELAPQLRGVFLDAAIGTHLLGGSRERVVSLLSADLLMQPDLMFDQVWGAVGILRPYEEEVLRNMAERGTFPNKRLESRVASRRDWLSRMNRVALPEPAEPNARWRQSPKGELLMAWCEASDPEARALALQKLLLFELREPVGIDAVRGLIANVEEGRDCVAAYFSMGNVMWTTGRWNGYGMRNGYPYSIPVERLRSYPQALGSAFFRRSNARIASDETLRSFVQPDSGQGVR